MSLKNKATLILAVTFPALMPAISFAATATQQQLTSAPQREVAVSQPTAAPAARPAASPAVNNLPSSLDMESPLQSVSHVLPSPTPVLQATFTARAVAASFNKKQAFFVFTRTAGSIPPGTRLQVHLAAPGQSIPTSTNPNTNGVSQFDPSNFRAGPALNDPTMSNPGTTRVYNYQIWAVRADGSVAAKSTTRSLSIRVA